MIRQRPVVVALWVLAALAIGVNAALWLSDLTYPGVPWQTPHKMADFRDTIWGPGHYLLSGGNPYDPARYLAATAGAQEFDPYAPAWLLLSALAALLPFPLAAAAYLTLGATLALVLMRVVLRWAMPSHLAIGTPLGLLFLAVWPPGRYALQNGGTLLVVIGWVLIMRTVLPGRRAPDSPPAHHTGRHDMLGAAGLALALLKPQFGLPLLVVVLASRRWSLAVRGLAGLAVASAPVVVACTVAAGGLGAFLDSIRRLVDYASSPTASTGLMSPMNERTDIVGLLVGATGQEPPAWLPVAVPLLAAAACVLIVRYSRSAVVIAAATAAAALLGLVHQPYDMIILLVPFVLGLGHLLARRELDGATWAVWALAAVPVVHLHTVTTLVPGVTGRLADTVDAVALAAAMVAAVATTTGAARGALRRGES